MRIRGLALRRRVLDGRAYAVVDRPPTTLELASAGDSIHIVDSDPPISSLTLLHPIYSRIRHLTVTDAGVLDISGLRSMCELVDLDLWPNYRARGRVEIELLPRIETLAAPRKLVSPIRKTHGLRELLLEGPGDLKQSEVDMLDSLESLRLTSVAPPTRFPVALRSLSLHGLRWSRTGQFVGIDNLQRLEVSGIGDLPDLSSFQAARRLRELIIEDCPDLHSLGEIRLPDDCVISMIGNTPLRKSGG